MIELNQEVLNVVDRYNRRSVRVDKERYSILDPAVWQSVQERQRALIRLFKYVGLTPLPSRTLLEIGCGSGYNLLELLCLGFRPENLVGNELLPERCEKARHCLPTTLRLYQGDASVLDFAPATFDIVYQSTVFTSLLDDSFQQTLADRMWSWIKPGGGVLWYDFIFNNPNNCDVRGVSVRRIQELFPKANLRVWKVTLAPPISRRVTRIYPAAYHFFNVFPFLRTHVLCWIAKRGL